MPLQLFQQCMELLLNLTDHLDIHALLYNAFKKDIQFTEFIKCCINNPLLCNSLLVNIF